MKPVAGCSTPAGVDVGPRRVVMAQLTCPSGDAELAADLLWSAGAGGVQERMATPFAHGQPAEATNVDVADSTARVELLAAIGPVSITEASATALWATVHRGADTHGWHVELLEVPSDYAELWRHHAAAVEIDDRLCLVPAWQSTGAGIDDDGRLTVAIEPAGAFGLGDHPTTRLCAGIVARVCRAGTSSLLDVGCGSGVLAIIAAQLGVTRVRAIDVAPAAVLATGDNARRNAVATKRILVDTTPIGELDGRYDVVVANILAPALIELAEDLRRLTATTLVVSGVIDGRFDHVVDALAPFRPVAVEVLDGWAAVILQP